MPEFYSFRLALPQEIDRVQVDLGDLFQVKHDSRTAARNERLHFCKML
jgi:hypothetical protein